MDIGDIVMYGGKRFSVQGLDPVGAEPRLIYLRDVKTGEAISVPFAEPSDATPGRAGLRLVDEQQLS